MNEHQAIAETINQIYSKNWGDVGFYLMSCVFYIMLLRQRLNPGAFATSMGAFALCAATSFIELSMLQQAIGFIVASISFFPFAIRLSARYDSVHRQ